MQMHYILLTC